MNASHAPRSTDAGASHVPSDSFRHLFFTGPRPPLSSPGTNLRGESHVAPSSWLSTMYVFQSWIADETLKYNTIRPSSPRRRTGFHCGTSGISAKTRGFSQTPPIRRLPTMQTSGALSLLPWNQAARKPPSFSSSNVDAWTCPLHGGSKICSFVMIFICLPPAHDIWRFERCCTTAS